MERALLNGHPVLLKKCVAKTSENRQENYLFALQAALLCSIQHPNIVRGIGITVVNNHRAIIIDAAMLEEEFAPKLADTVEKKVRMAFSIASALDYVHSMGFVHSCVSGESVLYYGHFKLANFGK